MTEQPNESQETQDQAEEQAGDQDAGPGSQPTGAAAGSPDEVDQDAEPASVPDQ